MSISFHVDVVLLCQGVTVRIGDIVSVQTTPKVGDRSRLEAGQSLIAILGKVTDILDSHVRIHQMVSECVNLVSKCVRE